MIKIYPKHNFFLIILLKRTKISLFFLKIIKNSLCFHPSPPCRKRKNIHPCAPCDVLETHVLYGLHDGGVGRRRSPGHLGWHQHGGGAAGLRLTPSGFDDICSCICFDDLQPANLGSNLLNMVQSCSSHTFPLDYFSWLPFLLFNFRVHCFWCQTRSKSGPKVTDKTVFKLHWHCEVVKIQCFWQVFPLTLFIFLHFMFSIFRLLTSYDDSLLILCLWDSVF